MKNKGYKQQYKKDNKLFVSLKLFINLTLYIIIFTSNLGNLSAQNPYENMNVNYSKSEIANKFINTGYSNGLNSQLYIDMIKRHDQYQHEFARWRELFARHAKKMAQLIKTYPGSENFSEYQLIKIFSSHDTFFNKEKYNDVFAPWTNRWTGQWSNGTQQYHIWEPTIKIDGRMIQPVTLSEKSFISRDHVGKMVKSGNTDIAINVFSRKGGITGWVSKHQHGRYELPHIGYQINNTTLLWITQIKEPGKLSISDDRWFVFLETVNKSANPTEYSIYGQPVIINKTPVLELGQKGKHHGIYYSMGSSRIAIASGNLDFLD
jgi:hypothetical protein